MVRRSVRITSGLIDPGTVTKRRYDVTKQLSDEKERLVQKRKKSSRKKKKAKKAVSQVEISEAKPVKLRKKSDPASPKLDSRGRDWVCVFLNEKWVPYVDKRAKGGALWVRKTALSAMVVEKLKMMGADFGFSRKGGKATEGQPAWFLGDYPGQPANFSFGVKKTCSSAVRQSGRDLARKPAGPSCRNCSNSGTARCAHGGFRLCSEWREKAERPDHWPAARTSGSMFGEERFRSGDRATGDEKKLISKKAGMRKTGNSKTKAKEVKQKKEPKKKSDLPAKGTKKNNSDHKTSRNASELQNQGDSLGPMEFAPEDALFDVEEGTIVLSEQYGFGEIDFIQDARMFVVFEDDEAGVVRKFSYPEAFLDGSLTL